MSMVDEVKAELEALGHDANRVPESVIQKYLRELGPVGDEESNEKHEEGAELTVSAASPSVNAKLPDDAAAAPIVDSESDDGKSEHAASASATVSSSNSPHRPPRRSDPVAEYASFARSWSKCSSLHSSTPRKRVNFFKRFQQLHEIERQCQRDRRQNCMQAAMANYDMAQSVRTPGKDRREHVRAQTHRRMRALNASV